MCHPLPCRRLTRPPPKQPPTPPARQRRALRQHTPRDLQTLTTTPLIWARPTPPDQKPPQRHPTRQGDRTPDALIPILLSSHTQQALAHDDNPRGASHPDRVHHRGPQPVDSDDSDSDSDADEEASAKTASLTAPACPFTTTHPPCHP